MRVRRDHNFAVVSSEIEFGHPEWIGGEQQPVFFFIPGYNVKSALKIS